MGTVLDEPTVVERAHGFLRARGVSRLFTDTHDSLRGRRALEPYQRFTVNYGDFVVHPDLVALESDGETLIAVEAKGAGARDAVLGLSRAELYQPAFHRTYLAADAGALGPSLTGLARQKNIGLLAVADTVAVLHEPEERMPLRAAYRFVARQMEAVQSVADGPSFSLNLPTHYLVWAIALEPGRVYDRRGAQTALGPYPIQDVAGALRGARSLGLLRQHGDAIELTDTGSAFRVLLPTDLHTWAEIHREAASRDRTTTLATLCPVAAAGLRLLLLQNATVRLIIEGLRTVGGTADLVSLAEACDRLDHARSPVIFLIGEALPRLQNELGRIAWRTGGPTDFRTTVTYQLKSVLRHAGVLAADLPLRGNNTSDPSADRWALA